MSKTEWQPGRASTRGAYQPISAYGAIGDGRTAALVGQDGSIDWLCWPRFDSPSVFGALLDSRKGGRFQVCPNGPYASVQHYQEDTNILTTTFTTPTGTLELTDFMTVPGYSQDGGAESNRLVRVARCTWGEVSVRIWYQPRPGYGQGVARLHPMGNCISLRLPEGNLLLTGDVPLECHGGLAETLVSLKEGKAITFALAPAKVKQPPDWKPDLERTKSFWMSWTGHCSYQGPWRKAVLRSALALKLLIYAPTGAVIAAPTTSLPEEVGGVRNWDYRYAWLRDAGMTLNALFSLGYTQEAERYADWVIRTLRGCQCGVTLKVMFTLDSGCSLQEVELDHLEGYRGSKPVRIGNAAHNQEQLDVYGEVLDCLGLCRLFDRAREPEAWATITSLVEHVASHWRNPDYGIWEVRSAPRHFVYSKVMAWVALDRAVRAAGELELPADLARWSRERDHIKADILERGIGGSPPALARAYDDPTPDAANLLAVGTGLLPPEHPLLVARVDLTRRQLGRDALVYRYLDEDGLPGREGAFLPCSFWLVEALAKTGRVEQAAELFEELLSYTNSLGLLPEEIDPDIGEYLGNYPQALSHIALINAAQALAEVAR